jgi:hypothetical protein
MEIGLIVFLEIVMLGFWIWAFVGKNLVVWTISAVLAGLLAFMSVSVETLGYAWDPLQQIYIMATTTHSYLWLMGVNIIFFVLALVFVVFDIFEMIQSGKRLGEMRESN